MLYFLKKAKKNTWRYHYCTSMYQQSCWYDLQLWYKACQTEIDNFGSFFALLSLKNPKKLNFGKVKKNAGSLFYTRAPKIMIIWCTLPEIWSVSEIFFCQFGPFFVPLPLWWPEKSILKKWKKHLKIFSFYTCVP